MSSALLVGAVAGAGIFIGNRIVFSQLNAFERLFGNQDKIAAVRVGASTATAAVMYYLLTR